MIAALWVILVIGIVLCLVAGKLLDDSNVWGLWLLIIGGLIVVVSVGSLVTTDLKNQSVKEQAHLTKSQAARQEMVNTLKADNWEEIRSNDTDTVMKLNHAVLTIIPTKKDDTPSIKLEFSGTTKPVEQK